MIRRDPVCDWQQNKGPSAEDERLEAVAPSLAHWPTGVHACVSMTRIPMLELGMEVHESKNVADCHPDRLQHPMHIFEAAQR